MEIIELKSFGHDDRGFYVWNDGITILPTGKLIPCNENRVVEFEGNQYVLPIDKTTTMITKEDKNLVVESLTNSLKNTISQIHIMENTPDLDNINVEAHKLLCQKRDSLKSMIMVFSALKKGLTIEII